MQILTHRGLEPLNKIFNFVESSKEAFENHLQRGFGLEFDINFTKDDFGFIFHDSSLSRITCGNDKRKFDELTKDELLNYQIDGNGVIGFEELLQKINFHRKSGEYSALHLKSKFQGKKYLDLILSIILNIKGIEEKIFIFDVKIETAKYIKSINKNIKLFPSVAHDYDIERYNDCTGGTLLSISQVLENKNLFDGVWLDEWDRRDKNGSKTFYNKKIFDIFREKGLLIGLVTPELHSKSPGLLGGEAHEDCKDLDILNLRFNEIIKLNPDFVCSDYLEFIK